MHKVNVSAITAALRQARRNPSNDRATLDDVVLTLANALKGAHPSFNVNMFYADTNDKPVPEARPVRDLEKLAARDSIAAFVETIRGAA